MIKSVTIKIKDQDYLVKQNYRAFYVLRDEFKKSIDQIGEDILNILELFYCILKANNDVKFSYNEFLDLVSDGHIIVQEFTDYLQSLQEPEEKPTKKKTAKK